MEYLKQTWHDAHEKTSSWGDRLADKFASVMGSWSFIVVQSIFVVAWILLNIFAYSFRWDPYPFILLNLVFSTQAFFAGPIILMAQNRQTDRDRAQALADYETNTAAKLEIEQLQESLARIETAKLDEILRILKESK